MTDPVIDRLRNAATEATRGLELEDPRAGSGVAPESPRHRGRWLTAAASLIAAAVVGVVVWVGSSGAPDPDPPASPSTSGPSAPQTTAGARERLMAAVDATRQTSGWTAEVTGSAAGDVLFVHQAPDRVEMKVGDPSSQGWVSEMVTIGTDMYVLDGGEWTLQQQDWRTSAPFNLIDELERLECVIGDGSQLAAWREPVEWEEPSGECSRPADRVPADLPFRSLVWSVSLDPEGRLRTVERRQVLYSGGQRVVEPDPSADDPFERAGAVAGTRVELRYDDVPPVTVPEGVTGGA